MMINIDDSHLMFGDLGPDYTTRRHLTQNVREHFLITQTLKVWQSKSVRQLA